MFIDWVNNASFILESAGVRLICDPWLDGTIFNSGWKLLSEIKLRYEDFGDITHIWLSHEHPDHFSPPNLRSIPEQYRRKITVLFHETKDKRVVNVCKTRCPIAAGTVGLATLVHSDTQVGRNDLFKLIQGIAYLRKHALARWISEELRDSEQIVASFDLHTKISHKIKGARLARE